MTYRKFRYPVVVASATLVTALAAGLLLASGSSAHRDRRVSRRPNASLVRHFAILRSPVADLAARSNKTALPARIAALLVNAETDQFGLNTSQAREAQPTAGIKLWLVPGSAGSCVVGDQGGGEYASACYGLGADADGPVSLQMGSMLVGFVPDGSTTVTVSPASAQVAMPTMQANVVDNAYAVSLPTNRPEGVLQMQLGYTNAAGPQTLALALAGRAHFPQADARRAGK